MMQAQYWSAAAAPASTTTAAQSVSYHHQPTSVEEIRTLWIGDLQYWVDENYLAGCFSYTGDVISIKIIRNKISGQPEGYGFIEFVSHAAAEKILQTYNGLTMPGTDQTFRLNWASFGIGERRPEAGPDHSIFVGDLAPDVTDYMLQETFRVQYPSVRGAKVVTDPNTGRSKGYGFVKFGDETEKNRAMTEMNGMYCSTRAMRISAATPKKTAAGAPQQYPMKNLTSAVCQAANYTLNQLPPVPPDNDITNTTIFVGGLDPNVTEEELKQIFSQFGELIYVKIPAGKGCGFVQFSARFETVVAWSMILRYFGRCVPMYTGLQTLKDTPFPMSVLRASAEDAIQRMHGTMIGQQIVRLSWGRSPASKQEQSGAWGQDPNQWANAYYGYGYDAYGYTAAPDPSLYAYGAYAGYGQYPQQVEGVQDMSSVVAGAVPMVDHRDESYDPLAIFDVDKLNSSYLAVHGSILLGRPLWLKTSSLS